MQLSDVTAADLPDVLALNCASLPHLSDIDTEEMRWFAEHAPYFRVARRDKQLAGFLIGLRAGLPYQSVNYRWFVENYPDFGYVDRVAVAKTSQRQGVASRLYEDFAGTLVGKVDVMTCEVNLRPANDSSMQFHTRMGFVQVGSQQTEGGQKEVALLEKRL